MGIVLIVIYSVSVISLLPLFMGDILYPTKDLTISDILLSLFVLLTPIINTMVISVMFLMVIEPYVISIGNKVLIRKKD